MLNNAGWEDTVLWNPFGDEGMGYNNFVCVESVKVRFVCGISFRIKVAQVFSLSFNPHLIMIFFLSLSLQFDPVTLDGGSTWTGDMALKPGTL